MAKKNYSKTESHIIKVFSKAKSFTYGGVGYKIIESGKPRPNDNKGECKTDVYILVEDNTGLKREFKISIKQPNADFIENKVKLKRAIEIFGKDAQMIIEQSIKSIKSDFEDTNLMYFKEYGKTKKCSITLGWRFDFVNKQKGKRCSKIILTDSQKIDIYAGINLSSEKRNCKVNGKLIEDSGIANFIINTYEDIDKNNKNINYYASKMVPIAEYVEEEELYFACRAVNCRYEEEGTVKWERSRDLAVVVKWSLDKNNNLTKSLLFNNPLSISSNIIGKDFQILMPDLNQNNFYELEQLLDKKIKYIK